MAISDTIAKANEQIAGINDTASSMGLKSNLPQLERGIVPGSNTKPTSADPSTLSSDSFTTENDFDLNVDTQVTTPQADRFQQDTGVQSQFRKDNRDILAESVNAQKAAAATATSNTFDDYINEVLTAPTFSELEAEQYRRLGVDEKQLVVDQLDTQMLAEQDALRTKIERIEREGGGLKIGAQSEIANLERESIAKQADIALKQLAAQDQLDYATRVADRAVDAMFERQEKIEQVRREIYENNKELFDKADQRAFELAQSDRERRLNNEREDEKILQSIKVESLRLAKLNNAPQSVSDAIADARSPEEVLEAGGKWGAGDMLDQEYKRIRNATAAREYDKLVAELNGVGDNILTADQRKQIAGMPEAKKAQVLMTLNSNMTRLKDLYETYGTWNPVNREAAKRIESLRAQLEIDIAVAGGQGAISEQEADRYSNMVGGKFFGTGKGVGYSLGEAIKANDKKIQDNIDYVQAAVPGATVFEPFAQFLEQKEAEAYIEKQLNQNPTTGDLIDNYVNSFQVNTSTPAI